METKICNEEKKFLRVDGKVTPFFTLPFMTAIKRGMGPKTSIVGKLNKGSMDKVFTSALIDHIMKSSGKRFPIGCYIQYHDTNNNESYGYWLNKSVYIVDNWIESNYGHINIIGGEKRYPKSFLEFVHENYPPTVWLKQRYGTK